MGRGGVPLLSLFSLFFFAFFLKCFAGPSVYVMLPLTIFDKNNTLVQPGKLNQQLRQLASAGVAGVNADVWWGLVETQPEVYNWAGYLQLIQLLKNNNLKAKLTLSFHSCGGNVGDECNINLPPFVRKVGLSNPDIYYRDQHGQYDHEYLSLGVDFQPVFLGRTGVDLYTDFMTSFQTTFQPYFTNTITTIQVGLGPAGELRYPSYQLDKWVFPGVGEFQCYDKYMLASLRMAAVAAGHPEWGNGGPNNSGNYNSRPWEAPFFSSGFDNFRSPYGQFFLSWYSRTLIQHGYSILSFANKIFFNTGVRLEAKISGIHWWYTDPSHAAELTAGFKNDDGQGYYNIIQMLQLVNTSVVFTCFEMRDSEQSNCGCDPEGLVGQSLIATQKVNNGKIGPVLYSAENALSRYDETAYQTILYESNRVFLIHSFSYLRLNDELLNSQNFPLFASFVNNMKNLKKPSVLSD